MYLIMSMGEPLAVSSSLTEAKNAARRLLAGHAGMWSRLSKRNDKLFVTGELGQKRWTGIEVREVSHLTGEA